jgi:hypothetical protein
MHSLSVALLACGFCVTDSLEPLFPPALAWSVLVPIAYLGLCVFSRSHDVSLPGVLTPWTGAVLVAAGYFLGAASFGPLAIAPFAFVCVTASMRLLRRAGGLAPAARTAGRNLGVAALVTLAVSGAWTWAVYSGPVTAARVLAKEGYPPGWRPLMERLQTEEPASLPAYREIVTGTYSSALFAAAVDRVVACGRVEEDVPFLLETLQQRERKQLDSDTARLERVLARWTGLDVAPGAGAEGWRAACKGVETPLGKEPGGR